MHEMIQVGSLVAGKYRVESLLGQGAMGKVFKATHMVLNQIVALKVLHPKYAQEARYHKRFMREARVTTAISHPNVVKVTDAGEWEQQLYLVMEFLQGVSLEALLGQRDDHPFERKLDWCLHLAQALEAAHELGLVHRDLKPENLMIEQDAQGKDRLVVVDFGLAFIESREDAGRFTANHIISGTPNYMSPEQASAATLEPPTDIYSFGCILYELLTGQIPFVGKEVAKILAKHIFTPPISPSQRAPHRKVHPVLEDLTLRMLQKDPKRRPDARQVLEVLQAVKLRPEHTNTGRSAAVHLPRDKRMGEDQTHRLGSTSHNLQESTFSETIDAARYLAFEGLQTIPDDFHVSLGIAGWEVCDWEEAKDIYPDLIITMSGDEEMIQKWRAHCAVIGVAQKGDMDALKRLSRHGCDDILSWPIQSEQLLRKIERALKSSQRRLGKA